MVIIITGASHTGKTILAQRLLEEYHYPMLSIDHLKMGLIRSGQTNLTPYDDELLVDYLWPIVAEMIKTVVENKQNLIIEGCYVPCNWRETFASEYLSEIRFICLAMSQSYLINHFDLIKEHASDIEQRLKDDLTIEGLIKDNEQIIKSFASSDLYVINDQYEDTINAIINKNKFV